MAVACRPRGTANRRRHAPVQRIKEYELTLITNNMSRLMKQNILSSRWACLAIQWCIFRTGLTLVQCRAAQDCGVNSSRIKSFNLNRSCKLEPKFDEGLGWRGQITLIIPWMREQLTCRQLHHADSITVACGGGHSFQVKRN